MLEPVRNYLGGQWHAFEGDVFPVQNPATGETLGQCPMSSSQWVDDAVAQAQQAFPAWRDTPAPVRARYLFKFKALLDQHKEEIAKICTLEHGKTLAEARGDIGRGIENVEHACGTPTLLMGQSLESIASGIDCATYRQPLGVVAAITPFNFPPMVPMWFLPYAIATGNTFILKPSERVPLSQQYIFNLLDQIDLPKGVVSIVNGGKDVVNALCDHPTIKAVSFVGSTSVAKHVYSRAGAAGKRVQSLGGAKNFLIVDDTANFEQALPNIAESIYGCAGQRCLAGSVVIGVGDAYAKVKEGLKAIAQNMKVGNGLDKNSDMGPVITPESQQRIVGMIDEGIKQQAELLVDGRGCKVDDHPKGNWVGPTVFDKVTPDMTIAQEEVFGPVACLTECKDLNEAVELINQNPYGNAGSIYSNSGKAVQEYRRRIKPAMLGVNIGIAAPMAFFPFGGSGDSFFGSHKAHGQDAVDFYTDRKVEISRWF